MITTAKYYIILVFQNYELGHYESGEEDNSLQTKKNTKIRLVFLGEPCIIALEFQNVNTFF